MTNSNEFEGCGNLLVLITGASRGIGKELARQLAIHFSAKKIHFFLLARNKEQLEKTKKIVEKWFEL
jgi:short-subunit dehydrogenase